MASTKVSVGLNSRGADFHLCPGKNLYTGLQKFIDEFGEANSLEEDALVLAAGVFGADLAVKRENREHFVRTIELSVEVVNLHVFERIRALLESALYTVSKDNWAIKFVQKQGTPVTEFTWQQQDGAVLLFSGGLDSMCAAAQFMQQKKSLVLVSHNSHANHVIDNCQTNVHNALEKFFKAAIKHIHIKVYGRNHDSHPFPKDEMRENTQRTRSFLFLSLAALITRRVGFSKVLFMAENGQFAIHLPLNSARVGPFSTHTADPEFILKCQGIFQTLLSNPVFEIDNPFLFKTKAEVIALLPKPLMKETALSASCWMISRIEDNKHCGYCIPCITRRIALEYNKVALKEYHVDIFKTDVSKLKDDDDKKRNMIDYLEFITKFKDVTEANKYQLLADYPELYNEAFDLNNAIDLYKRVSSQSFEVLKNYPKVMKII